MSRWAIALNCVVLLLTPATVALGVPKGIEILRRPAPPLSENARKHFNAGVAYADDPSGAKWEEAYREFLAAYADTPSWVLKNNIGLCALNLERDAEAIAAYREYLDGGGEPELSTKGRKQIETDIATLSASLVKIEIQAEPSSVTLIDERRNAKGNLVINNYPVTDGKVSLGIHPGRHRITAEAPGYTPEEWVFEAGPATTHSHAFKLVANAKTQAPATNESMHVQPTSSDATKADAGTAQSNRLPTGVAVGLAATGVFTVAATVTGLMTLAKQSEYNSAPDRAEADRRASSGKTLALMTDLEIGAAIVSAGVTAYLYFTAPQPTKRQAALVTASSADRAQTLWRFAPMVGLNTTGFAVAKSF